MLFDFENNVCHSVSEYFQHNDTSKELFQDVFKNFNI